MASKLSNYVIKLPCLALFSYTERSREKCLMNNNLSNAPGCHSEGLCADLFLFSQEQTVHICHYCEEYLSFSVEDLLIEETMRMMSVLTVLITRGFYRLQQ